MSANQIDLKPTGNQLGNLLRHWRKIRGRNQFDLSFETGFSQRHISFIESGRSIPSRQTLLALAQALDVPLRERNLLLLAAGYAPFYSEAAWNSMQMQSVTKALDRILRQHEPFPAIVMDRYWNVLLTNQAAPRFFGCFIDMSSRKEPRNMLHLIFDPDGMRPFVDSWDAVAASLIQRVKAEAIGRVVDDKTNDLLAALLAYPDARTDHTSLRKRDRDRQTQNVGGLPSQAANVSAAPPVLPTIPISFRYGDQLLNYFSMVTTVGTPQTVAAQELRIESMFPADEATEEEHLRLLRGNRS
jgi:transcriptional regulator with XRE-family HTH domain